MFIRRTRKGAITALATGAFLLPAVQMCEPEPTPPPPSTTQAPPATIADPCPSCHDPLPPRP